MSITRITVTIDDPGPVGRFGRDVVTYSVACEVDGEPRTTLAMGESDDRSKFHTIAEMDAEVCELVGTLIVNRGEVPVPDIQSS